MNKFDALYSDLLEEKSRNFELECELKRLRIELQIANDALEIEKSVSSSFQTALNEANDSLNEYASLAREWEKEKRRLEFEIEYQNNENDFLLEDLKKIEDELWQLKGDVEQWQVSRW